MKWWIVFITEPPCKWWSFSFATNLKTFSFYLLIPILEMSRSAIHFLTRMHSSRMRTARSSSRPGGPPSGTPHPQDQAHTPARDQPLPPGNRHHPPGPGTPPWTRHSPLEQAPLQEQTPLGTGTPPPPDQAPHPPVNRITDACENITLPQLRCGR